MPMRWLRPYMREHDRLMAAESIQAATRIAVGTGRAKNRASIMRHWRDAQGVRSAARVDAHDRGGVVAMARQLGVPVRVAKVKADG